MQLKVCLTLEFSWKCSLWSKIKILFKKAEITVKMPLQSLSTSNPVIIDFFTMLKKCDFVMSVKALLRSVQHAYQTSRKCASAQNIFAFCTERKSAPWDCLFGS